MRVSEANETALSLGFRRKAKTPSVLNTTMTSLRRSLSLLEEMMLLEDREQALMAKFVPAVANMIPRHKDAGGPDPENHDDPVVQEERKWWTLDLNYLIHVDLAAPVSAEIKRLKAVNTDPVKIDEYRRTALANAIVRVLIDADPDRTKSFSTWLIQTYLKKTIRLEDLPRFTDALKLYGEAVRRKKLPVEARDINRIRTIEELEKAIAPFREEFIAAQDAAYEARMLSQCEEVYRDAEWRILVPHSELAAQWFGRATEWCTAWGGEFSRYPTRDCKWKFYVAGRSPGPLFMIFQNGQPIYQYHGPTNQFQNVLDKAASMPDFNSKCPAGSRAIGEYYKRLPNVKVLGKVNDWDVTLTKEKEDDFRIRVHREWSMVVHQNPNYQVAVSIGIRGNRPEAVAPSGNDDARFDLSMLKQFAECLNRVPNLHGSTLGLTEFGIAWDQIKKRFIPFAEEDVVGSQKSGLIWRKTEQQGAYGPIVYYQLHSVRDDKGKGKATISVNIGSDGSTLYVTEPPQRKILVMGRESKHHPIKVSPWPAEIQDHMFELLTKLANRKALKVNPEERIFRLLEKSKALQLAKLRPDWVSVEDAYYLFGDTPALRRKIVTYMRDEVFGSHDPDEFKWVSDKLTVVAYDGPVEFFEERGDSTMAYLAKIAFGDSNYEVDDPHIDDDRTLKILEAVRKTGYLRYYRPVVQHMRDEYPDEAEAAGDLDDPKNLLKLQKRVRDRAFKSIIFSATVWGERAGAEGEIYKAMVEMVNNHPNLSFFANGKLLNEYVQGCKVVIIVSLEQAVAVFDHDAFSTIEVDGWIEYLEPLFFDDRTYWTEFDMDSAVEGFSVGIDDNLTITDEQ